MIEGLDYWNLAELEANWCRILTEVKGSDLHMSECSLFVHVPYFRFRVSSTALDRFCETKSFRVGIFLARMDLTDVRHVVFGFTNETDQDALLATAGVVLRRPNEHDDRPKYRATFQ